jgi:ribulose 1,5-bisphosphate synthetase/thiazole synthase
MSRRSASFALLVSLLATPSFTVAEPTVLNTDVAIIGGGAAGTYAAVRLREDFNTRIVLMEPRDYLGGSVSTHVVPETNTTFEYGV